MVALHTAIAIIAIIWLIIGFKVDPVVSLVLGCCYLGLASGVGFTETVKAITEGFGEIMVKVGLLIGFGVLMGALLHRIGAFKVMVDALVRVVPAQRLPYALALALATIAPSIYVDVQVVLAAPVARSSSRHIGRLGLPWLAGALGTGVFCGYVFVVPGLSAISIAGLMEIKLGVYLLFGVVIGPLTALVTVWLFRRLLNRGWWQAKTDENPGGLSDGTGNAVAARPVAEDAEPPTGTDPARLAAGETGDKRLPLPLALAPILVPLLMIAFGAFARLAGVENPLIDFIGNANVALFLGLLGAYTMARLRAGGEETDKAFADGLRTSGEILLVTGVGGSLGAVIEATGLDRLLGGLFSVSGGIPGVVCILLAWFIAALLHLAIGSVSVAAITAAGILAPIAGSLPVAPVIIGLAIASGSMFALQVNSNFFWMFKSLLGLTTQGTLKTMTTVTATASLVSLPMVMVAALIPA